MDKMWTDEGKNAIHVKTSRTVHLFKGDITGFAGGAHLQTVVNKPSVALNSSQALIEQAWLQSDTFPFLTHSAGDVTFAPLTSNG